MTSDGTELPSDGRDDTRRLVVLGVIGALLVGALLLTFLLTSGGDGENGAGSTSEPAATSEPVESTTADGPATTEPLTTRPESATTSAPTTLPPITTTTIDPYTMPHQLPIDSSVGLSYAANEHHDYPATDIFATTGCGTPLTSPVPGVVDGVEANNPYDRATDDPALRGGNWVSILGDDGVRYYMAHFQSVDPSITPGVRVTVGQPLGLMGDTGRAGACHVHLAFSPGECPVSAWWIRRGVVFPSQYLDAWRAGENRSPLDEVEAWLAAHPTACTDQNATGFPVG